jgi:hypothetical protein
LWKPGEGSHRSHGGGVDVITSANPVLIYSNTIQGNLAYSIVLSYYSGSS